MTETKFTPAPWKVFGTSARQVADSKSRVVATLYSQFPNGFMGEVAKPYYNAGNNSHLIAAAPELYEALKSTNLSKRKNT